MQPVVRDRSPAAPGFTRPATPAARQPRRVHGAGQGAPTTQRIGLCENPPVRRGTPSTSPRLAPSSRHQAPPTQTRPLWMAELCSPPGSCSLHTRRAWQAQAPCLEVGSTSCLEGTFFGGCAAPGRTPSVARSQSAVPNPLDNDAMQSARPYFFPHEPVAGAKRVWWVGVGGDLALWRPAPQGRVTWQGWGG